MPNKYLTPENINDKPLLMPINDVFTIVGRGTIITGKIERGIIEHNNEFEIVGLGETKKNSLLSNEMKPVIYTYLKISFPERDEITS